MSLNQAINLNQSNYGRESIREVLKPAFIKKAKEKLSYITNAKGYKRLIDTDDLFNEIIYNLLRCEQSLGVGCFDSRFYDKDNSEAYKLYYLVRLGYRVARKEAALNKKLDVTLFDSNSLAAFCSDVYDADKCIVERLDSEHVQTNFKAYLSRFVAFNDVSMYDFYSELLDSVRRFKRNRGVRKVMHKFNIPTNVYRNTFARLRKHLNRYPSQRDGLMEALLNKDAMVI